jgi:hypothetical protein
MKIAQYVILNTTRRPIGKVHQQTLTNRFSKPCPNFGGNQSLPWNPFSLLFGKIHQVFTWFSKTALGQWLGKGLKKIDNFLQAPKKEPVKPASPAPAPRPETGKPEAPATVQQPPEPQKAPDSKLNQPFPEKETPKGITPHEKLMGETNNLLTAQNGIQYKTLSIGELSKKLSAFKQARDHCQSQKNALSQELSMLQALKINQTQIRESAKSECHKLKKKLERNRQDNTVNALSPEAAEAIKRKRKAKKGLISELKTVLELLETKIQGHSRAFEETSRQFDKMTIEVEKLESWEAIQTEVGKIQPLPGAPD